MALPLPEFGIEVVEAADCFGVGGLAEVSMIGRKVRAPEEV